MFSVAVKDVKNQAEYVRLILGKGRDSQKLNNAFQFDHALAQGLPSSGLETTRYPPHSLVIGWESPGSFLPIG
jgi:hypothetical protein